MLCLYTAIYLSIKFILLLEEETQDKSHHFKAATLCFSRGSLREAPGISTSVRVKITLDSSLIVAAIPGNKLEKVIKAKVS